MLKRLFSEQTIYTPSRYAGRPEKPVYDKEDLRGRLLTRNKQNKSRRAGYMLRVELSAAIAIAVVYGLFQLDIGQEQNTDVEMQVNEMVVLDDIQQTRQMVKPPPPPRPAVPIEVPDDATLDDVDLAINAEIDFETPVDIPPPPVEAPPPPIVQDEEEFEVFMVVEEMPTIIGGLAALNGLIEYPTIARQAGIQGMVVVQIIVDEEGNPTNPVVVKEVQQLLNEAAVDAVMKVRFTPGKQRGKKVPVQMAIPVRFVLNT